jgi:hypothetical protein
MPGDQWHLAKSGQATAELSVVALVLAVLLVAVFLGSQVLSRAVALNGASRAAAFAAAYSATDQYALGTLTPNPTAVAQAVGTAVSADIPGVDPTVAITPTAILVDAGDGHTFTLSVYQVQLQSTYQSPIQLFPSTQLASASAAPVAPATPGSGAAPTSTPTATTCWVDVSELQSYSNPMSAGTGFYQVFTTAAGTSTLPVEARWNVTSSTDPISPTGALEVALYSGTPFGNGYGSLTTAQATVTATPLAQATSTTAMDSGEVPTMETSPGITASGAATTYTVLFLNGSSTDVTTAPAGLDPDQQGAQVQYYTSAPAMCSS